ncbi:MAG: GHKL domain-containing protein [Clostridiales bacterium]|nr:GHKL domain-containing protein [Clostridiales bacterium]
MENIPKLYTALAEWLACVAFVVQLKPRRSRAAAAGTLAASLLLLCLIQYLIGIVPVSLWIPGMIVALAVMYGTILFCCQVSPADAGLFWAIAFMFAEFAASLEWQFYSFFAGIFGENLLLEGIFLLVFYGVSFYLLYRQERHRLKNGVALQVFARETVSAVTIAIGSFLISNISYVSSETPLSGKMSAEIFYIRALVDLAGVVMLFALQDRWQDLQVRKELDAIHALLQRQYEQYRISRENMEAVNRKYHDLKHQISVIRLEPDAARREEYLTQLESGIRDLGAIHRTGNDVLDTILSSKQLYCSQNQITMTVMADGAQLAFLEVMDICSIFGNALDNAIESVGKLEEPEQRLIRVAVYLKNGFLVIQVENFCAATPEAVDGEYQTTKADKENHGYGIKSIRYVAQKYDGTVSVRTEDGWFYLKVLIPRPGQAAEQG